MTICHDRHHVASSQRKDEGTWRASALETLIAETERADWPSTVHLEVELPQRLDAERLTVAAVSVAQRHRLVRARLVTNGVWATAPSWHEGVEPWVPSVSNVADSAALDEAHHRLLSHRFDLGREMPVQLHLLRPAVGPNRLVLIAHHAALDGGGAWQLMSEIAAEYAGRSRSDGGDMPPPSDETRRPAAMGARRPSVGILGGALSMRRATRLVEPRATSASGYGVTEHVWRGPLFDRLITARPLGVTVNDMLVSAVHLACEDWNRSWQTPCDILSVAVPVDVSPSRIGPDGESRPVANRSMQTVMRSSARQRASATDLLAEISDRLSIVRDVDGPAAGSLGLVGRLPGVLRRSLLRVGNVVVRDSYVPTCRLSNLGRKPSLDFSGPGEVAWFSPPLRPPQLFSIGVVGGADHLTVAIRWCRSTCDEPSASRFAQMVRESTERLLDTTRISRRPHEPSSRKAHRP